MEQLNSKPHSDSGQINTSIIPVNENHSQIKQTETEQYSTLELIATAGAMLVDVRAAVIEGDTETALDLIDMADCELHTVYSRLDFVAAFRRGVQS